MSQYKLTTTYLLLVTLHSDCYSTKLLKEMVEQRQKIKWLSVLNRDRKIAFLSGGAFLKILISGVISGLILGVSGRIELPNFVCLWLLLFLFAQIFTHTDDYFDLFLSVPDGKKSDWVNVSDTWIPQQPHQKLNHFKTIDGFEGIPFSKFSDLDTILPIQVGKSTFTAIVCRSRSGEFYAYIPLIFEGIHPDSDPAAIEANLAIVSEAMNSFPPGERLSIVQSCRSNPNPARERLSELGDRADAPIIGTIYYNQRDRATELTRKRIAQQWTYLAFCSWHSPSKQKYAAEGDFWAMCAIICTNTIKQLKNWLFGVNAAKKSIYADLGRQIYRDGYLTWLNLFNKAGLPVRPMEWEQVWEHFWYIFNSFDTQPQPIPYLVAVKANRNRWSSEIFTQTTANRYNRPPTLIATLLSGTNLKGGTPSARVGNRAVKLGNNYCGIAYLKAPTVDRDWYAHSRMRLFWDILSQIGDATIRSQVKLANKAQIQSKLVDIGTEASNFNSLSAYFGDNYNTTYDNLGESSRAARNRLDDNTQLFEVVVEVNIYRDSLASLELAMKTLCQSTTSLEFCREEAIAAQRWLETLPINDLELLGPLNQVASRSPLIADSLTLPGYLPLAKPKDIDSDGIEFFYQTKNSGYPIFVNPFKHYSRIAIAGKTGSGKSALLVRMISHALAQSIPVIILDLSLQGTGTYELYVKCLGKFGAFINLLENYYNPLEPPYWHSLDEPTILKRFAIWQSDLQKFLMLIWTHSIEDSQLIERIRIINATLLQVFWADPIVDRALANFQQNGQSARGAIPTLPHLKQYLTPLILGLIDPSPLDLQAIEHINRAIVGIENDPFLAKALCSPSNLPFNPMMSVFAFSTIALKDERNSLILSGLADLATTKLSLSHRKSFLIIEEFSRLKTRLGFSRVAGDSFNMGRKEERVCAVVVQDLEDLQTSDVSTNILSNYDYCFIGKSNRITLEKYRQIWNIPEAVINQLCGTNSQIDRSNRSSLFLLGYEDFYLPVRSFSSAIETVLTTTNGDTKHRRDQFLARTEYSSSLHNILQGVTAFAQNEHSH